MNNTLIYNIHNNNIEVKRVNGSMSYTVKILNASDPDLFSKLEKCYLDWHKCNKRICAWLR